MPDKVNNGNIKLYIVAAAFTLSVGFSFYGIKKCVPYADPLEILAYRYLAALAGLMLWTGACRLAGRRREREPGRPKGKLYLTAFLYIAFMIFQIAAMFFATSIEGAIIFAMVPVFAKIIGRIALGEKATLMQNVFVVITVAALMVLIVLNATDISLNGKGIILMTVSSLLMACQNVSTRYVRGVFRPSEITECIVLGGFPVFAGAALVRAAVLGDLKGLLEPLSHPDFIIWVSFLGVVCIVMTARFMAYMLSRMQIVQSTIFNSASTLISIVAGALLLGEPLRWYHYICGAVIVAGVIGMSLAPVKEENSGRSLGDDIRRKGNYR